MKILDNMPLAPLTTFKIGGKAQYFIRVSTAKDVKEATDFAKNKALPIFVMGGASNMLISDSGFAGVVIYPDFLGMRFEDQDAEKVNFTCASGENWDNAVLTAVSRGLWGIENLSGVPGKTGGVAVQNVGAYGQEAKQTIVNVNAINLVNNKNVSFANEECEFGYRKSIFNTSLKDKFIITGITFRLSKLPHPILSYSDVAKYFATKKIFTPSLNNIRQAILEIRSKKLPDPAIVGNAGSFFKNPVIDNNLFNALMSQAVLKINKDKLENYRQNLNTALGVKIPAAFLIEFCGLTNLTEGGAALCKTQPVVIVNESGHATALDVLKLSGNIRKDIFSKTKIRLLPEPNFLGFTKHEMEFFKI